MALRLHGSQMDGSEARAAITDYISQVSSIKGVRSAEVVLSEVGQFYTVDPSIKIKKMPNRECYRNAYKLSQLNNDLQYVEGIAIGIIPTKHAWCVTLDGKVVDPTWPPKYRIAYFGVPIDKRWLNKVICATQRYGLIEEWQHPKYKFPLSRFEPSVWLAKDTRATTDT